MLEGFASKVLGFIAKEFVPFVLSVLVRNAFKKAEKKNEEGHEN